MVKEMKGVYKVYKVFVNLSDLKMFRSSLLCAGLSCVLEYSLTGISRLSNNCPMTDRLTDRVTFAS